MHGDKLEIKYYLQKLPGDDLAAGQKCAMAHYDHAPKFCAWLDDVFAAERVRRLRQHSDTFIESEHPTLAAAEYSNSELTQALCVVTALSYKVRPQLLGEFMDKLVRTIVVAVGARLKLLEEIYGSETTTV